MERIAEYMALSQESWGGSQPSQGRQDSDNRPNDPTVENPQTDTGSASLDNAYDLIDELFMTPESEDDESDLEDLPTDDEEDEMDDNDEEPLSSPLSAFLLTATPSTPGSHVSDDIRDVLPSLSPTSSDATSNTPVWEWTNDDTFVEPPLDFTGEATFTEVPTGDDVELRFFLEFFTDEIVELIVQQSNLYFTEVTTRQERLSRRNRKFKKITKEDILRMIATRICMGLDKKPTQANYWSNNPFYKSEIVPLIMTSDRYKEVMQFLHFCDNAEQVQGDRLHKIRNIWELFNERLGLHCTPGKNICIDESLVSFKGNLSFRQYIPSKSAKMGIKLFGIGDSETGYILWAIIYEGKGHQFEYDANEFGFGGAVALELAARYLHSGRCLYMDNYFINARIAKELLNLNTNICGTLRKRLKCNPKMTSKIKAGATEVYSCDGVMVERWKDKREVCMLSTGHEHYMTSVRTKGGKLKLKPQTVLDYNKYSRAIDKMDMVTGTYDMNRKSNKWYKKLFFKMLEICLYNANILYSKQYGSISNMEFKERVVLQILRKYGEHKVKRGRRSSRLPQRRHTERHFMERIPATETNPKPSRECVQCRKQKRRQTRFQCPDCKVALCNIPCFKNYHTP